MFCLTWLSYVGFDLVSFILSFSFDFKDVLREKPLWVCFSWLPKQEHLYLSPWGLFPSYLLSPLYAMKKGGYPFLLSPSGTRDAVSYIQKAALPLILGNSV
ncbi:hypothetical protein I7I48_04338 [Histoplasma ohiense]|nr:hypothetical protein I7I48_04338 [Histoplasma ohiense (nom. inval.)]